MALATKMTVAGILALLTLTSFSPVLNNAFVSYDDGPYVTENGQVRRGLTGEGVVWAFTATAAANWHPVTWLSHMLDVQLWGLKARGHHTTSLLLHAANAILLFLLLEKMTGALWPSALVGALFAVHPLHVESVAWVAERKDVLSFLFLAATLVAYDRYARKPGAARYALIVLFYALGLMAKPILVTVPFVLLLLDYWPLGRTGLPKARLATVAAAAPARTWARLVREKIPLIALAAASSAMTLVAQSRSGAVASLEGTPLALRAANAMASYGGYLVKTIWPVRLAVFYPYPEGRIVWAWSAVASVGIAAITFCTLRARSRPFLVVGWLWYLGTLVPVIGLVQVGAQAMADRYTYLPLTGIFVMAAWSLLLAAERLRRWVAAATVAVLFALAARTFVQTGVWRSSLTLFSHALEVTGQNALAHNGLGNVYYGEWRLAEAEVQYREAVRCEPENPDFNFNLGLVLSQMGRLREAEVSLRRAVRQDDGQPKFHNDLGRVLERLGNVGEASRHYRRAIELDGTSVLPRTNEGALQFTLGNYAAAIAQFREVARLQPGSVKVEAALAEAVAAVSRTGDARP